MAQSINLNSLPDYEAHIQLCPLIDALHKKKRIIVIAGAGISVAAGIPTFDDMPVGSRRIFDMYMYNDDKDTKRLHKMMCDMYHRVHAASATQFHLMLAALAEEGRLLRLYTQNIDGIDTQLAPLKTLIPLPKKGPWPKTVQLHGDLRTVRCLRNLHLSSFDPALFDSKVLPFCGGCEEDERSNKGRRTPRSIPTVPVVRPRIWLYNDFDYPDEEAITKVMAADFKAKPDAIIVVGTALKVASAKIFAQDICRAAHEYGGFTAWINLQAPPRGLDCLNLVVKGNCETVAEHVSSWWLKECPAFLSDSQIQNLQEKCKLFITRTPEAALNRAFTELDNDSLSKILQQNENRSRILNVKENGKVVFASTERSQITGSSGKVELDSVPVNKAVPVPRAAPPKFLDSLPELSARWRVDMSKRLSEVVEVVPRTEGNRPEMSSTVVTPIMDLGYLANPEESLWRLKTGEYVNDEIINAYLELLQRSIASPTHRIAQTFTINMRPDRPYKWFTELINTGAYTIYLPINQENYHWSFAVIKSKDKEDALRWTYYDSIGGGPPRALLDWIHQWFYNKTIEELAPSPNPRQKNGVDCGLFVLIGIRLLSAGRRHLTQAESNDLLPNFRERVLAELLASSLDPSDIQFQEFKLKETNAKAVPPQVREDSDSDSDNSDCMIISPKPDDHSNQPLSQSRGPDYRGVERSPEHIASTFAEEATMLNTLRDAIAIERAAQKRHQHLATENLGLAELWLMIRTEKRALKQRYIHYEFARQFWAVMKDFNRSPNQRGPVPKGTISKVMGKLEITDRANWKYILKRARRVLVWTELSDIFKGDLEHPSVVLCAVPDATYRLERLTLSNRKLFFEAIRSRLKEPGNGILARLKASSALYRAVMHDGLPARDLPIESANKVLPFEQMVRSGK